MNEKNFFKSNEDIETGNDDAQNHYDEGLSIISESIEVFPERAKICFEKTRNNHLECAVDLVSVILMGLHSAMNSNKGKTVPMHVYSELNRYEKEIRKIGDEIRSALDVIYKNRSVSDDVGGDGKKDVDEDLILKKMHETTGRLKVFIESLKKS